MSPLPENFNACARITSIRRDSRAEEAADAEEQETLRLEADLDDCPLCGEFAARIQHRQSRGFGSHYRVECAECETSGPHGDDPQEAFAAWNDRKPRTRRFLKILPPSSGVPNGTPFL